MWTRRLIAWLVLRRSLFVGAAGLVTGLAMAFAATRWLESVLWGVNPTDTMTYLGVCLVLLVVVMAASYLPVRRAVAVDPAITLRHE